MSLKIVKIRPDHTLDFTLNDSSLSELTGYGVCQGLEFRVRVSRNVGREEDYGVLEIQQRYHSQEEAIGAKIWGSFYENTVPLPKQFRSLVGDSFYPGGDTGKATLESPIVKPWVYPDAEGDYPEDVSYSLQVLTARLTVEQADFLFAMLDVDSWEQVLAEQETR